MIYLLLVSFIWAFSFGLIKGNLTGVDSNFVAFARLAISLVIFLPLIRLRGIKKNAAVKLAGIGMVQYGLMYLAYIYSYRFLQAYEVALFTIFTPLYVTVINDIINRKFYWKYLISAGIAIVGTGVVIYEGALQNQLIIGFLIMQVSNICFAIGQVFYRKVMNELTGVREQSVFGLLYFGAFLITGLFTLLFTDLGNLAISTGQIFTLIYLGVVASGIGFFLWNFGARRTNIGALAIFNNLKIPLAITVSLVFFQEQANIPNLIIGGLIVVFALAINEFNIRELVRKLLPVSR